MPEGGAFTNQIQTEWMCYNCFVLWCVSGSKAPLAFVWHKERFYTAGPVLRNSAGGLADGKPWGYKRSNRNGFTMPTHVTNLAFGISTKVPLALQTNWLLALFARSALYIMANQTCMALQRSSAKPSWAVRSLTLLRLVWWKLVSSAITNAKET